MKKGRFITFEGCEGVGKSWQMQTLKRRLDDMGIDSVFTREPGGSRLSEQIRALILSPQSGGMSDVCEALLYGAARAQHLADIVLPALNAGKLVVCDRFADSTEAYQGYARGLGDAFVQKLADIATGGLQPELTVFLDLPPDQAFKRKGGADDSRMEQMDIDFHRKVYEGYKRIERRDSARFIAVDASGEKQETQQKILDLLRERGIV